MKRTLLALLLWLVLNPAHAAVSGSNLTVGSGSGASATTASVSPGANDLVFVSVSSATAAATAGVPTVTGASMTWVQVATVINATNVQRMTIFRGMSASPGSGTLTIDFAGQSQGHINWSVDDFTGTDTTGANGSGAIVQSQTGLGTGTQTGITVNLSAFGSANNAAYGAVRYNATAAISAGAGFTALGSSTTGAAFESEWEINQTAVAWTWTSVSANVEAIALEIKAPVVAPYSPHSGLPLASFGAGGFFQNLASQSLTTGNAGFAGATDRIVIPTANLNSSFTGTGLISVTFTSNSASSACTLAAAWIGEYAGLTAGNAPKFDGNQVQLKFAGSASKGPFTGVQTWSSDPVTFAYNGGSTQLIVSTDWTGTTCTGEQANVTSVNNFLFSSSQAGVTAPTGTWSNDSSWTWAGSVNIAY